MVVELDLEGKVIKDRQWTLGGRPVHVQRLENGRTLVTLQQGNRVVEIDEQGQEKWSTKLALQNPFSAQRLPNGNTLVTSLTGTVVEVGPDGEREEWKLTGLPTPYHAERISNGNILVADRTGVQEYDVETKKSVWSLAIQHVSRAHRY
jgi:outer membrane protein assembly factor BamB